METIAPHLIDRPLESILQTYGDFEFTCRDFANNTLVIGSPGSGKSSGVGRSICTGVLTDPQRIGCIFTTVKQDDYENLMEVIRYAGREEDVILFSATGLLRLDWLAEARKLTPPGGSIAKTVLEIFLVFREMLNKAGSPKDSFWDTHTNRFLLAAIILLIYTEERLSAKNMERILDSMPRTVSDLNDNKWASQSYCMQLISLAYTIREQDESENEEIEYCFNYFLKSMVLLEARTFANIIASIQAELFEATTGLMGKLMDGVDSNFSLESVFDGKIIILDIPASIHNDGNMVSAMCLYLFQKMVMLRPLNRNNRMVATYIDECQLVMNKWMVKFTSISRSQNCMNIFLTQSIPAIKVRLGQHSDDLLNQFTNNMGNVFMLSTTDPTSLKLYADLVGKDYLYKSSFNSGVDSGIDSSNVSEDYRYIVPEKEFRLLATGSARNNFCVEAVLICSGRSFGSEIYLRVVFDQLLLER